MRKAGGLLISLLYIISIVNCQLEVPIDEPKNIIEIEETRIMNDFIVKPIDEYPAYFVQGNAVSGIPADCKAPTDLIRFSPIITVDDKDLQSGFDKFFIKDGKIYFIISLRFSSEIEGGEPENVIKYCEQSAGKITYLTEAKFPAMPISERVTGTTGIYAIEEEEYNENPISIARRDYYEPFVMIDGFIEIDGGLLIHTPTGRLPSRPAGLLFWPEGLRTMNHWKEAGRFWK